MFTCSVCSETFGHLTSLKNHKKVHKNWYKVDETDDSNELDIISRRNNYNVESKPDNSMDTYNSGELDIINRQNSYSVKGEIDNSMDTYNSDELDYHVEGEMDNSTDMYNSDELDAINRQNNELTFDDQESADEYNLTFDTLSIADKSNLIFNNRGDILENSKIINEAEFQSDVSESEIDNTDFPSTAYRDFIDIVIRYNLSYTAGDAVLKFMKRHGQISKKILLRSTKDGLLFLDTLRKDHTKFHSTPVAQIKDQTYSFEYRPIISAVKEILQHQEITKSCIFDYQEVYTLVEGHQKRLFSEFYNSKWWSPEAKALVGIIPTLQGTKEERQTSQFRQLIRLIFHKCINILIEPLRSQYHSGVSLKITRTEIQMRQAIEVGQGKDHSLHEETNSFWNHPNTLVNKMDQRLGLIPRHPELKIFSTGLADLALFTASEYRHMMKVMPFVLEGLFERKENELLIQMFVNWNKIYFYSKQSKFTQTDLVQFEIHTIDDA
ncbi:9322_t:CDS:2 [Dentiscutata heterogama]|uniref:9322_t:CDS:1 n=1 Tax=Dentiscutata heterogama TaxID=1316150 RepID=A0ACA9KZ58_9GLOM|nr:9322_t:CDS:2 [Dentiscutata heterogama]